MESKREPIHSNAAYWYVLSVGFLHSTVSIVTVKKSPALCHSTGGTCTT